MSTDAGATRRRGKEGFAANGSSEDLADGVKVQCVFILWKSRDCRERCASFTIVVELFLFFFIYARFMQGAKLAYMQRVTLI